MAQSLTWRVMRQPTYLMETDGYDARPDGTLVRFGSFVCADDIPEPLVAKILTTMRFVRHNGIGGVDE